MRLPDCLAAERAVATDCLLVIRCHSHEFTGHFEGERERDTALELVRSVRLTQLCSLQKFRETPQLIVAEVLSEAGAHQSQM